MESSLVFVFVGDQLLKLNLHSKTFLSGLLWNFY
jgi:hypothetical protein